jgi:acyl-CoA reductase-like NAD-dependent aldehyde dehydrogenase
MTEQKFQQFINGKWVGALHHNSWDVLNPATEEIVATIPFGDGKDARLAIEAAEAAFPGWRNTNCFQRANKLKNVAARIREGASDFARITTRESGKPLVEATGEWMVAADLFEWFAEEAKRTYGTIIPANRNNKRSHVIWQPVGVVGIITAWNFPVWNLARAWGAALAAGCTIVAKPSEYTPLTAMLLTQLFEKEEFAPGVVNLLSGDATSIGDAFLDTPALRKIHFVGSTRVGKILMDKASETNTRLSLELGGNAPVLVFPDVDVQKVAASAVGAKFRNCGQVCISPQRFLVHQDIYGEFNRVAAELVGQYRIGNGLEADTQVGPLINRKQQQHVAALVETAVGKGAKVMAGGEIPATLPKGYFYRPTLLAEVGPESPAFSQEVFGPVLPVTPFSTFEEAISLANATEYGLASYVWTNNLHTAIHASEALEFGIVGINEWAPHGTEAPFGGWKQSGQGSELGHDGIFEYMEKKLVSIGGL